MRSKILGLVVGCGLIAAAVPALACPFNTQASSDQQQQQTAQAQTSSQTSAQ